MGENTDSGSHGEVLSNRRRQLVLSQLQSHGTMTVRDLAEQIATSDQNSDIESLSEEAITEVEVALHHVHAPKLANEGYVDFDPDAQLVRITKTGREVGVENECTPQVISADRISVELCAGTVDRLYEAIHHDDRLDARMSYDEVIDVILSDFEQDLGIESSEEAR